MIDNVCDKLNLHRCIIYAKQVMEEGEEVKGAPVIKKSNPNTVSCIAKVMHVHDEEELRRYIDKMRFTHDIEIAMYLSWRSKALKRHIFLTAGIAAMIVLMALILHAVIEFINEGEEFTYYSMLKLVIIPITAAAFTFGIELLVILREHIS